MPAAPTFTLTATLENITGQAAGSTANPARLQIMLCNFGLYLPAIVGNNNQAEIFKEFLSTGAQISTPLWGNDLINPAGTYYAITVLDGQGRVVQCAAYLITGTGTFDLSTLVPIFILPRPPAPPPINSLLEIVTGNPPTFHANTYLAFKYTLTANVLSSIVEAGFAGNLYTFVILQDSAGGHTFTWPTGASAGMPVVDPAPNSLTVVVALREATSGIYRPAALGTYYDPAQP